LLIAGKWRPAASGKTIPVLNPATEEGHRGARRQGRPRRGAGGSGKRLQGLAVSAYERSEVMRKAADPDARARR